MSVVTDGCKGSKHERGFIPSVSKSRDFYNLFSSVISILEISTQNQKNEKRHFDSSHTDTGRGAFSPSHFKAYQKDLESLDERQWIVMLEEPVADKNAHKQRQGNEEAWAEYEQFITQFNEDLKVVVAKHWNLPGSDPVFKIRKEVEAMSKGKSSNRYALFFFNHRSALSSGFGVKSHAGLTFSTKSNNTNRKHAYLNCEV